MDDMKWTFMQIVNYRFQLKDGSSWKKHDQTSLILKVVAHIGDPKLLVEAMRSYPGAKDLNTIKCTLEGLNCLDQPREYWTYHCSLKFPPN